MKIQQKTAFFALFAGLLIEVAAAAPGGPEAFLASALSPVEVTLPEPVEKSAPQPSNGGPLRVGDVRALPKSVEMARWASVEGGYVARLRATSRGALGMRIRLDLGAVPGAMLIRAQGSASPRIG